MIKQLLNSVIGKTKHPEFSSVQCVSINMVIEHPTGVLRLHKGALSIPHPVNFWSNYPVSLKFQFHKVTIFLLHIPKNLF